jgi:RES domain-containing protein
VRVWRICRKPFTSDTLAGRGGLFTSGRWHTVGRTIVYTSQSLALAALEVLVQVDRDLVPSDLIQVEIDIPEDLDIRQIDIKELPKNWKSYPAPPALQERGNSWRAEGLTPVLQVPSSLIPEEANFLINPQHENAHRVKITSTKRFAYDSRLTT